MSGGAPVGGGGGGESKGKKKLPKPLAPLNIVPMLDVCFNLLIFFIMTAQFSVGEGILPADLPRGDSVGTATKQDNIKPPPQPLILAIRSLGGDDVAIDIQGVSTPPANYEELYKTLMQVQVGPSNPNGMYATTDPVIIKPDDGVPWGNVVNAFNAAIRAKFTNVNFGQNTGKK